MIAMAESDFYDPSQLYFSVFEVGEGNEVRLQMPRAKIDMPEEDMTSPNPVPEEVKTRRACDHHG